MAAEIIKSGGTVMEEIKCPVCNHLLAYDMVSCNMCFNCGNELFADGDIPEDFFSDDSKKNYDILAKKLEERRKAIETEANRVPETSSPKLYGNKILMTTGSAFDGYVVEKYIDVICEEIIFKNSFIKQISASFVDLGNAISFREREMSGANSLISRARELLMEKFRLKAAHMGANAILGIDFETSFGSDVVRAAVNGTAVVIRKKEDA